jgi:hypothetical protein
MLLQDPSQDLTALLKILYWTALEPFGRLLVIRGKAGGAECDGTLVNELLPGFDKSNGHNAEDKPKHNSILKSRTDGPASWFFNKWRLLRILMSIQCRQ